MSEDQNSSIGSTQQQQQQRQEQPSTEKKIYSDESEQLYLKTKEGWL